jgi:hypothetical protein
MAEPPPTVQNLHVQPKRYGAIWWGMAHPCNYVFSWYFAMITCLCIDMWLCLLSFVCQNGAPHHDLFHWNQKRFCQHEKLWLHINGIKLWSQNSRSGLSVLIFRGGRRGGHEKSREGPEHENQWQINCFAMFLKNDQTEKWWSMYQEQIFLDETGHVLNEKTMPDATVMIRTSKLARTY